MFSLSIVFGPGNGAWTFMFKTRKAAEGAMYVWETDNPPLLRITDDFGQSAVVERKQIHGILLDDLDESGKAHIERALAQARTQAKANNAAMADPTLKASQMMQNPGNTLMMRNGPRM